MKEPFTISLGSEELTYLLRALHIDTLDGFTNTRFLALDIEQQALALAVADRSLRARHCIKRTGRLERQVEPEIVGLFTSYAQPDHKLTIQIQRGSSHYAYQYARAGVFTIEHQEVDTDIHQFIVIEGREETMSIIGNILHWKNIAGDGAPATLPYAHLQAARTQTNVAEMRHMLGAYLTATIADNVATTFANPAVIIDFLVPIPETMLLTVAQGARGIYLLQSDLTSGMTHARPAQSNDVVQEIDKVLATFLG